MQPTTRSNNQPLNETRAFSHEWRQCARKHGRWQVRRGFKMPGRTLAPRLGGLAPLAACPEAARVPFARTWRKTGMIGSQKCSLGNTRGIES